MTETLSLVFGHLLIRKISGFVQYRINLRIVNKICTVDTAVKAGLIVYGKYR